MKHKALKKIERRKVHSKSEYNKKQKIKVQKLQSGIVGEIAVAYRLLFTPVSITSLIDTEDACLA